MSFCFAVQNLTEIGLSLKSDNRMAKKRFLKRRQSAIFGRPLGQAYAIGNPSVRPSVCNVDGLWPNGLSDRDDFWHTPCPGQQ